ncbi:uncharacterized protein LOC115631199 [Scaptodrosophila lebanonensis]|uniref:Uncharacterized protein LOC115622097 n=1 Tax=Drosophila lebanonensis TaxID=7225 RepID=A0A6J2U5Y4_DROLE|nr:uncharacterized protein LOC115622097 [Scaptodrosophila lebanonensis]XP_030383749.1 uncharacterized protein LOC115631199 [Scaptodrosophila lebanonensis]
MFPATLEITAQPSQRHHFRYLSEGFRAPLQASELRLETTEPFQSPVQIVCQLVQEYEGHDGYFVSPNTLQYIGIAPNSEVGGKTRKRKKPDLNFNFEPVRKWMTTIDSTGMNFTFKLADYCIAKTKHTDIKENVEKLKESITPELVQLPPDDVITQKFGKDVTVYLAFTAFTVKDGNRWKICETVFSNGILNASESVSIIRCFNEKLSFEGEDVSLLLSDVKRDYQIKLCNEEGNWESAIIKPNTTFKKLKTNSILAYKVPKYDGPNSSIETAVPCKLMLYDGDEILDETKVSFVRYATTVSDGKCSGNAPIQVDSEIEPSTKVEVTSIEILPPLFSHDSNNNPSIGDQPI